MSYKGSSPTFKGEGYVQRLAKHLQREFKIAYSVAVTRARASLGLPPAP